MTTALPLEPYSQWKTHLSEESEKKHQENAAWWNTAQTVTITALCTLGVAILISPYILPISYTSLLMNAFAVIPFILPIPGYFYNYCVTQATLATKLCEKIIFFRKEHSKIEHDTKNLDQTIEKTFEGHLSNKKRLLLQKTQEIRTPILSHLAFLTNEVQILEEKKEELHSSIIAYKEKDFDSLLKNPLLANWQEQISQAKKNWIKEQNNSSAQIFLQDLTTLIEKESSDNSQSIGELKKLSWQWHHKDSLSLSEKWIPLFLLEEKILMAKVNQLFLWTFLLRPEKELSSSLEKHDLQIEDSLFEHKVKKNTLSLTEFAIGKMYQDPATEIVILLPNGAITKKEILDPTLKEQALDKLLLYCKA